MATPAPTATWKNGPTFEHRPAANLDMTPVHFMPSFPASTGVLRSRSRRDSATIFTVSGDGDGRQLQGHPKDSGAVQRASIPTANIKQWTMDADCKDQDVKTDSRAASGAYSSMRSQSGDYCRRTLSDAVSLEPHFVPATDLLFHKPRSVLQGGRKVEEFGENVSKISQGMKELISVEILDCGKISFRREDAQIPLSDERFFATDEMLYKLDGSCAYYNSMHSKNPTKFSGRMKTNALKPLPLQHVHGNSIDDSSTHLAKYQQNRFVSETILNSVRPVTSMDFPERSQHHPPDPFKMVRSFTPTISYSSPNRSGKVAQENQVDSIPSSKSAATNFSHSFSDSFIHIVSSPIVAIPCEISNFNLHDISHLPSTSLESKDLLSLSDSGIAHSDSDLSFGKAVSESLVSSSTPVLFPDSLLPLGIPSPSDQHDSNLPSISSIPHNSDSAELGFDRIFLLPDSFSPVGIPSPSDQHDSTLPSISSIPHNSDSAELGFDRVGSIADGELEEEEQPLEGEPEPVALFVPESSASERSSFKRSGSVRRTTDHVTFSPMVVLFDACFEGDLDTVMKTVEQVEDASRPNDDGITALHIAVCAGHFAVVKFLVEYGCNVNAADSDGWTPLHCSAACNNLAMTKLLVESGACIFAATMNDQETAAEKCKRDEEDFDTCHKYLNELEEELGKSDDGAVYAMYSHTAQAEDELSFERGDKVTVLHKGDNATGQWWFSRLANKDGYVPRNYFAAFPSKTVKLNAEKFL